MKIHSFFLELRHRFDKTKADVALEGKCDVGCAEVFNREFLEGNRIVSHVLWPSFDSFQEDCPLFELTFDAFMNQNYEWVEDCIDKVFKPVRGGS